MKPKLVRDKIPERIRRNGEHPKFHIAKEKEYESKLKEKLKEEVLEFIKANNKEEFVDILEVIEEVGKFYKFNPKEIKYIKEKKAQERGKFEKRIILDETK